MFDDVFVLLIAEIELGRCGASPASRPSTTRRSRWSAVSPRTTTSWSRVLSCCNRGGLTQPTGRDRRIKARSISCDFGSAGIGSGDRCVDPARRLSVEHKLADNSGARMSEDGFSQLVGSAEYDSVLAETVGLRSDIRRCCSAISCRGDRGGSAASVRRGAAGDASRNSSRAGEGLRRGRRQVDAARLFRRAAARSKALRQDGGLDERRRGRDRQDPEIQETVAALSACARCRSMSSTGLCPATGRTRF